MAGKKNYLSLAPEATFGTAPTTGWLGLAVEDLGGHVPVVPTLQPKTMVYGQQGASARGRRTLVRGATGALKPYLESSCPALLELLELTFGEPTVTVLAAGEAWERVYSSGGGAPTGSVSVQTGREFKAGGQDRDTFLGGQVEKMSLAQGMTPSSSGVTDEGLAKIEFGMNYRTMAAVVERLPVYGDPEAVFSGGDWTLSIGADLDNLNAQCLDSWGLEYMTGLDFEGAQCASSVNRDKAGRGALPAATLTAAWSYKDRTYYDAWINGTVLALRSLWQPAAIWLDEDETINPKFQVDIAAFAFTGDAPKEAAEGATKQDLPAEVLWNHTDDMVTITVVSSDAP